MHEGQNVLYAFAFGYKYFDIVYLVAKGAKVPGIWNLIDNYR